MATEEGDDPVVREIPVFLSTELSDVLYLIQHPLFNINRVDINSETPLGEPPLPKSARIRPKHGKLELLTPIPTIGEDGYPHDHYDEDAYPRQCIKEHRTVSHKVELQTHFGIGAMREGALHLTPVRRILQMRASLGHIDEFEEKELMEMETIDDKPLGSVKSSVVAKEKPSSIVSGYQKRESDRAKNARLTSWAHQHKSEMAENFVELQVHAAGSDMSEEEFQRMFYANGNVATVNTFKQLVEGASELMSMEVQSFEPASIAANHKDLPPSLSQLPIKRRTYLFQCAHAYVQQYGHFKKQNIEVQEGEETDEGGGESEKQKLSNLFSSLCEELNCLESVAVEGFVWFSQLPDFETSTPFRGAATYNYLTAETIKLAAGTTGPVASDSVQVAGRKAQLANNLTQENNSMKVAVSALIACEVYVALLFARTYSLTALRSVTVSLEEKVHALIRRSVVMPFDILLALASGSNTTPLHVMQLALQFAHLVHGNLVLKSDTLYGGEATVMSLVGAHTLPSMLSALATPPGTDADLLLCDMRDTLLVILNRDGFVGRLALNSVFEDYMSVAQIKALLFSLSVLDRPTRRWNLKHPDCSTRLEQALPQLTVPDIEINSEASKFLKAYDEYAVKAREEGDTNGKGLAVLSAFQEGNDPRRVDMIDAMPGFDPAYTGGRKPSSRIYQ